MKQRKAQLHNSIHQARLNVSFTGSYKTFTFAFDCVYYDHALERVTYTLVYVFFNMRRKPRLYIIQYALLFATTAGLKVKTCG